jgi:ubiquinone/menaquinone biosynthesis C-methylase UbiE
VTTPRIHDAAAAGFSAGSGAYERGRPSYPKEAVDVIVSELGIGAGSRVVDLAAGTGKFTALLVPTGAEVVAVEPVAQMGDELRHAVPGIEVLEGTAEAIPLPDSSVDALTVAQAFHWFDHDQALAEIARVLRPGGGLAFLWNRRDESVSWVRRMSEVLHWHDRDIANYEQVDWPAVVARAGRFTDVQQRMFSYEHELDRAGLADRVRSISYIAAMDEAQREALVGQVLALVGDKPERFPLPYNTLVFWCRTRS